MTKLPIALRSDPARVVIKPFLPAEDSLLAGANSQSRAQRIASRVLALDGDDLTIELTRWVGVDDDTGIEKCGCLKRIFFAEIGADYQALIARHRAFGDGGSVDSFKSPNEDRFNVTVAVCQAR